ncbi:hypothetical protein ONZ43_g2537 [Nemania bipapillata]|uniref:Uncharacterized protein n=1 Tax=Nemania bipapillata TaxID=110536 RepID=A0ACC2J089_9PEZI|nr:hypothetical protein ONZ43_g2537 [Nemania bipapillata]
MSSTITTNSPGDTMGSWNVGQIRRLENGEVAFTKTLEMPIEGIDTKYVWHPTTIDFTDLELLDNLEDDRLLWFAKHPSFNKTVLVKINPFNSNTTTEFIENETRTYQLVDGLGIAPNFLGHVTYQGAVIGFILEFLEGAQKSDKDDEPARLEIIQKLHALDITHGTATHQNFLKVGENMFMIDFANAKFGERATHTRKLEDFERIRDFPDDWFAVISNEDSDLSPAVNKLFDSLTDDDDIYSESR